MTVVSDREAYEVIFVAADLAAIAREPQDGGLVGMMVGPVEITFTGEPNQHLLICWRPTLTEDYLGRCRETTVAATSSKYR